MQALSSYLLTTSITVASTSSLIIIIIAHSYNVQLFHAIYAHCCWMPNTLTLHLSTKRYLSVQLFSRWTWVIQISSIFIHFFQVITLGDKWHWFPAPDVIAVTQSTEENTKHSPQQANGLILSPPHPTRPHRTGSEASIKLYNMYAHKQSVIT